MFACEIVDLLHMLAGLLMIVLSACLLCEIVCLLLMFAGPLIICCLGLSMNVHCSDVRWLAFVVCPLGLLATVAVFLL